MIALARQSGDRLKQAEHLGWLADTLALDGQYAKAEKAANAALAILAGMPEGSAHAKVYCHQAQVRMLSGDVVAAVTWGERAIALSTQLGDVRLLLFGLNTVGEARLIGGDEERGRNDLERCVGIASEAGFGGFVAAALANLGSGHAEVYRFDRAERYLTEAIAYATEREDDNWRHWSVAWLAQTRLFQGNWTDATDLAVSVLRIPVGTISDDAGSPMPASIPFGIPAYVRIVALLVMGRIRARRGDPGSDDVLAEALKLAGPSGIFRSLAPIRAARAEAAWLAGDRERMGAEASAVYDLAVACNHPWYIGELAYWRWKSGQISEAPPYAAAPYALQMNGDWAGAAVAWAALGCPCEAARALTESHDEGALREALATFQPLGARPAAALVTRQLRDLGALDIPRGPRPGTRSNPALLTPRELQVLELMATGITNGEIATHLFLSPKTIEHHVSAVLAKLQVRSRREAVQAATRLLLLRQGEGQGPPNWG